MSRTDALNSLLITRDTPVGYNLESIKKRAVIQLMGSRLWGRFNPNHWDPVYAAATGLSAPIQTGEMSSAYLAEMCVNHFGAQMFSNARMVCKYVASTLANEVIVMRNGVTVESGPTAEVFSNPKTEYTKALIAAALNLKAAPEGVVNQ